LYREAYPSTYARQGAIVHPETQEIASQNMRKTRQGRASFLCSEPGIFHDVEEDFQGIEKYAATEGVSPAPLIRLVETAGQRSKEGQPEIRSSSPAMVGLFFIRDLPKPVPA
jgi:hypothetical protein